MKRITPRRKHLSLSVIFLFIIFSARSQSASDPDYKEIDFVSDTQQPMAIEKIKLHANHNTLATSMIFSDILKNKPVAVYMLGDIVAAGSSNHKWSNVDKFLDSCRENKIEVHGLLGNHDLMWSRKKGEKNFQKRFPDNNDLGYVSVIDSLAIIMLNSNFKKLTQKEIDHEVQWYKQELGSLEHDNAIRVIIVSCHHAPYSNSLIVGSSKKVQQYFVPDFLQSKKGKLFITGHSHAFEHFQFSGKDFLIIGGGGGLHQPLDTSSKKIPDMAFDYKPMFHYLSIRRKGETLLITSHFLKPDFSGFENGYSFSIAGL